MVSAVGADAGKTSVAMAAIAGLTRTYGQGRVAYFKPIGQGLVEVEGRKFDRDAVLAKAQFSIKAELKHMSPVAVDERFTRRSLDGDVDIEEQWSLIEESFFKLQREHDFVVIEGMGHCAAGSVFGMSNAAVARRLGVGAVLVANGGLGSTFDELELNRQLLEREGVDLRGIVVNKVRVDKYDFIRRSLSRAVAERWGVPLLGCVPYGVGFDRPSLRDLEMLYGRELLSARDHALRYVVALGYSGLHSFVSSFHI
ncbi:unnamed protein product [Phaeothamnion confervicola]